MYTTETDVPETTPDESLTGVIPALSHLRSLEFGACYRILQVHIQGVFSPRASRGLRQISSRE